MDADATATSTAFENTIVAVAHACVSPAVEGGFLAVGKVVEAISSGLTTDAVALEDSPTVLVVQSCIVRNPEGSFKIIFDLPWP